MSKIAVIVKCQEDIDYIKEATGTRSFSSYGHLAFRRNDLLIYVWGGRLMTHGTGERHVQRKLNYPIMCMNEYKRSLQFKTDKPKEVIDDLDLADDYW